jgi:hypothetical protein
MWHERPRRRFLFRARSQAHHQLPQVLGAPLWQPPFLPMSRAEMDALGWDSCDIIWSPATPMWTTPALAWR